MYRDFAAGIESERLHEAVYAGVIGGFRPLPEMAAIVAWTRAFLEERFAPYLPVESHRHFAPAALAEKIAVTQRDYSRANEAKRLWRTLFEAIGLDPMAVARDRLLVRFQPPRGDRPQPWHRSTATVGFHRDSWGTNLYAQVNWWAPVYPISAGRTFAFFPHLWDRPIANSSADFDMAEVMRRVREEPGTLKPGAMVPRLMEDIDPAEGVPVTIAPGEIIAFSAQHAHAGVPNHTNLTRISLETRTLVIADHLARRGAPNIDGRAHWMAPGLFRRLADGTPLLDLLTCPALTPFEGPWPADSVQVEQRGGR